MVYCMGRVHGGAWGQLVDARVGYSTERVPKGPDEAEVALSETALQRWGRSA